MAIRLQKIWDFTPVKKSSHGYDVVAKNFQAANRVLLNFFVDQALSAKGWLKNPLGFLNINKIEKR